MKKNLDKLCIIFIATFLLSLTACQNSDDVEREKGNTVLSDFGKQQELGKELSNRINLNMLVEEITEETDSKEIIEQETESNKKALNFELPAATILVEISEKIDGSYEALTLNKDGILQFWQNQNVVCEKQIPIPSEIFEGNGLYEVIGNPYISKEGDLVLIQSYTTLEGEKKLDYSILANRCIKRIKADAHSGYVFRNYDGKYGFTFCTGQLPVPWYPYEGVGFNSVDTDNDFSLPETTTIWLNDSTVESVSFGSWGSTSYGYRDIYAISARLRIESYGELDILFVCEPFEPVEVDDAFFKLLEEEFEPKDYEERFFQLMQTISEYKQKN
ncbi:MAG: hypothetical protein HFJ48_05760 [Clostridia bacterium]|nr:hypothetical protein [Clostridia bacterium]